MNKNDPDFVDQNEGIVKTSGEDTIPLNVPRDILRKMSITNARYGQGLGRQLWCSLSLLSILVAILMILFVASKSTAKRFRKEAAFGQATVTKESFEIEAPGGKSFFILMGKWSKISPMI